MTSSGAAFTYQPAAGFRGNDGFIIEVSDGKATTTSAVSVTVQATAKRLRRCTINGTPRDDILRGTQRKDVICGRGGNDLIIGLGGHDRLYGGPGNDRLVGGHGRDLLDGQAGDDKLQGGFGSDHLLGGGGHDRLLGVQAVTASRVVLGMIIATEGPVGTRSAIAKTSAQITIATGFPR